MVFRLPGRISRYLAFSTEPQQNQFSLDNSQQQIVGSSQSGEASDSSILVNLGDMACCGGAEALSPSWTAVRACDAEETLAYQFSPAVASGGQVTVEEGGSSDEFSLFFANVTSWSQKAQTHFKEPASHAVALVEHRLCNVRELDEFFSVRGYYANAQPAVIKEARPSGGCMLATRRHLNCQPLAVGSHRWVASRCRFKGFDLVIVVAYFPVEGIFSEAHKLLRRDIGSFLTSLKGPWLVLGDFNCEPGELVTSGWPRLIGGQVCSSSLPTINTGSTIDYMVLHGSLEGLVSVELSTEVPWRPHYAVSYKLRRQALHEFIPTLPRLEPTLAAGPRWPWSSWEICKGEGLNRVIKTGANRLSSTC